MIIGITGKKRSGKDTVADYLVKKYKFIKLSIADPMKEACKHIFLMSEDQLWGDKKDEIDERYNCSPREILQVIGKELFQEDIYTHLPNLEQKVPSKELWINRIKLLYNTLIKKDGRKHSVVISDVRFLHEVRVIKNMGGYIIRVNRKRFYQENYHASEQEMDNIKADVELDNSGDFKFLYNQVDHFINKKDLKLKSNRN